VEEKEAKHVLGVGRRFKVKNRNAVSVGTSSVLRSVSLSINRQCMPLEPNLSLFFYNFL